MEAAEDVSFLALVPTRSSSRTEPEAGSLFSFTLCPFSCLGCCVTLSGPNLVELFFHQNQWMCFSESNGVGITLISLLSSGELRRGCCLL
ncbi:hypothetical protein RRG08_002784 [Elysia crispata]|uniref:Uncharacterized protein n=1 Tax=Elysia crispata TaxID=231223 RepID=A0AAE0XU61_9GAST|nr:hypothetical protein RRG08_002784 [Elysia crispata]